MKFRNPQNGYVEEVSDGTWLWCLLFGGFYFAFKGVWIHFIVGLGAAIITWGASWLIYPFFARSIVVGHYRKSGWQEVDDDKTESRIADSPIENPVETSAHVANQARAESFWQADRNFDASNYKIYLSEQYDTKRNELFGKFVSLDEMFDTLDEALIHADQLDRQNEDYLTQTVKSRGAIGPSAKFTYEDFLNGDVIVSHPSGAKKKFHDPKQVKILFTRSHSERHCIQLLEDDDKKIKFRLGL